MGGLLGRSEKGTVLFVRQLEARERVCAGHTEVVSLLSVCVGVLERCDVLLFRVINLVNALFSTMCQNKVLTSNCSHMYIVRLIDRLGAEAPCF